MALTPTTAAPPDQNSCRPLRPHGNNISIEALPTLATTRPTRISGGRELVPLLKVAVTKIDTTGPAHPRSTGGRGPRALPFKGQAAMASFGHRAPRHRQRPIG
jgi:hypothetical protein